MSRVLVAVVVASGLLAGFCSAAVAAQPAAGPGTQLWVGRYNGPGNFRDFGSAVAVSPDGRRVFVTGRSSGKGTGFDYATVAYSAATGARLWVSRYRGTGASFDTAHSVVVSRDSRTVYVTGAAGADAATIAYNAATGARRWVSRFRGSGCCSNAWSAAVSADGHEVFVTGGTNTATTLDSAWSIHTIAYSATTGARLWTSSYTGPGGPSDLIGDWGVAVVASQAGGTVYVAGTSLNSVTGQVMTTIAYDGLTGGQKWVSLGECCGVATSLAVSADGSQVITAGTTAGQELIGYDAATGAQLWTAFPLGSGRSALAASPAGAAVFAVGRKVSAYQAATGTPLWSDTFGGTARAAAVNQAGSVLYATGLSGGTKTGRDYLTVAYDAATGKQIWARSYHGQTDKRRTDEAWSVTVSRAGRVFVTGNSVGSQSSDDYATIAYRG